MRLFAVFIQVSLLFFLSACAGQKDSIGEKIANPTALVALPGGQGFFVVNGSLSGLYSAGSLQFYEVDATGKSWLRSSTPIPRLATGIAVSGDGKRLAVLISGNTPALLSFDISNPLAPQARTSENLTLPERVYPRQLGFFAPAGATPGAYFVHIVLQQQGLRPMTQVWQLGTDAPLMSFPKPEEVGTVGFSSPTFLPDLNLFVVFPRSQLGTSPISPYDYVKNTVKPENLAAFDGRQFSILAVDFDFVSTVGVERSYALVPVIYNQNVAAPVLTEASDSDTNKTLAFKADFLNAQAINANGCLSRLGGQPTDSVLMVDLATEILQVNGFGAVKSAIRRINGLDPGSVNERLNPNDFRTAILPFDTLAYQSYSKVTGTSFAGDNYEIPRMDVVETGNGCAPIWLRTQLRNNNRGTERSWIQTNFERSPTNSLVTEMPVEGVVGLSAFQKTVFVSSFSYDELHSFRYLGDRFEFLW